MLKLRKIAVTGSLGAGKTLVCQILGELGAFVVSADELVHELLASDRECIHKIALLFGSDVVIHHQVDRKKLAELAFGDSNKLKQLEAIVHPLVLAKMEALYESVHALKHHQLFVAEVPLLFEAGWERFFDRVIAVTADEKLCRKRSLAQGLSESDYALRAKRQLPAEEKKERADYQINNNTSREDLKTQIINIVNNIKTLS